MAASTAFVAILRDAAKRPLLRMREFRLADHACTVIISTTRSVTGERGMSGTLKIRVDQEKCQGHARCKSLAPELFELDEYGNAHEVGDGTVPKGLEDKAWLAQTNCPEIAIEITEE
jgi:ferredoxin